MHDDAQVEPFGTEWSVVIWIEQSDMGFYFTEPWTGGNDDVNSGVEWYDPTE